MNTEPSEREEAPERVWVCKFGTTTARKKEDAKDCDIEYIRADLAASRMRDLCVEKVKLLADSWANSNNEQWDEHPDLSFDVAERLKAAGEIITALESLTLDGKKE